MMNLLKISNFKCFVSQEIEIRQLTIMAGANGYGKSTAIQAILYLRNSIEILGRLFDDYYVLETPQIKKEIPLNDNYLLSLGNSSYVINRNESHDKIVLSMQYAGKDIFIKYIADSFEPKLHLTIAECSSFVAAEFPILKKEFYYLNAERIGPRLNQKIQFFRYPHAGWQGEFVAQLISERSGYMHVETDRLYPETSNPGIEFQVNEWLNYMIPGVRISVKLSPETFTAQIQIENSYTKGDPTIATNIGFGISYVLPIIATGLIAKKGSYFLLENPEAHLHPSAQSKIGNFLAMVSSSGVNVIIETHSDHVINGIQIAVAEKKIDNSLVAVNFFDHDSENNQPNITAINISPKGELTSWPSGFFDQSQIDYSQLIRLRKNV